MSDLLTAREVGEWLGLSPASVLRRWRAGELPGYRLGSNVLRFDRDDIDSYLADHYDRADMAAARRRVNVPGPATRQRPGPGTGGESHA